MGCNRLCQDDLSDLVTALPPDQLMLVNLDGVQFLTDSYAIYLVTLPTHPYYTCIFHYYLSPRSVQNRSLNRTELALNYDERMF